MKRPKIRTALICALSLIAITVMGFAAMTVMSMDSLNQSTHEISSFWLPKVSLSKDMSIDLSNTRRGYLNSVAALEPTSLKSVENSILVSQSNFLKTVSKYEVHVADEYGRQRIAKIKASFEEFCTLGNALLKLIHDQKKDEANQLQQDQLLTLAKYQQFEHFYAFG